MAANWHAEPVEVDQMSYEDQVNRMLGGEERIYPVPSRLASREFAQYIDHTNLKLSATNSDIVKLCEEARTFGFKAVCVRAGYVSQCIRALKGSDVIVASVVGFHEGA
jgi:deoxyribose-phosphate aldolase